MDDEKWHYTKSHIPVGIKTFKRSHRAKRGQVMSPKEKIGFSPLVCIAIKVILKSLIVRAKVGETEGKTRSNIQDNKFHLFF